MMNIIDDFLYKQCLLLCRIFSFRNLGFKVDNIEVGLSSIQPKSINLLDSTPSNLKFIRYEQWFNLINGGCQSSNLIKIESSGDSPLTPPKYSDFISNVMFGSLEGEENRREYRGGEQKGIVILHLVWPNNIQKKRGQNAKKRSPSLGLRPCV